MTDRITRALLSCFVVAGCVDGADPASSQRSTPPDLGPEPYKELLDNGDAPKDYGCLGIYAPSDTKCAMTPTLQVPDVCSSPTKLEEVTAGPACNPGIIGWALTFKTYDCTKVLNDPKARCVFRAKKCGESSSARCEVPTLGDNPTPGANDYCRCPVKAGETIESNQCPTRPAGDDCPLATCTVSKNGTLEIRECEHYLNGGGSGGPGAIGL